MSPQRSNRAALVEGTLRCLRRLPLDRITSRVIAEESGANPASIAYHFGSKEELVTEAIVTGLDRWLDEVAAQLGDVAGLEPGERFRRAGRAVLAGRRARRTLVDNFLVAVTRARHDDRVRATLGGGFRRTRPTLARLLGLGDDRTGQDAAALVLAMFQGLLIQEAVDRRLAVTGTRMDAAQARLRTALPGAKPSAAPRPARHRDQATG
jgi:AcrR family transcriptional regulator